MGGAVFYWVAESGGGPIQLPSSFPQTYGVIEGYCAVPNGYRYSWQRLTGTDGNRQWMRRATNATIWRPWAEFYHRQNIGSTVSMSGGFPAGTIIERGSNANGEYARWADGTQICWRATPITTSPAAFTGTPVGIDGDKLRLGRWI